MFVLFAKFVQVCVYIYLTSLVYPLFVFVNKLLQSLLYIHTWFITPEGSKTYKQSRQNTIKHKEEHKTQKDKKYTKLNYKNTIH